MSYGFNGTPLEFKKAILDDLHRAEARGADADALFRQAMIEILGLHDAIEGTTTMQPAQLEQFRGELSSLLLKFERKIGNYAYAALCKAEVAENSGDWLELCMRRSAIQLLLDGCAGTAVAKLIDRTDLAELDTEMRRVGEEQGPLPFERAPKVKLDAHWWWRYPTHRKNEY
jgi:hypothetical protein